jgi:ABC-2 type transport system permease protein
VRPAASASPPGAAGDSVITLLGLTKRYGELVAVGGVSFEVRRAHVVMRIVTSLIQTAIVLAVGMLLFHVSVNGSLLIVCVVAILGSGTIVSLGFTIASVSWNMEVAQAPMNVVQTPMMFLSGIFFPMNNAPAWIQPIVKLMPLTYLADALRKVIIDDATLWAVRTDILVLLARTAVFVVLAWRLFRWE